MAHVESHDQLHISLMVDAERLDPARRVCLSLTKQTHSRRVFTQNSDQAEQNRTLTHLIHSADW